MPKTFNELCAEINLMEFALNNGYNLSKDKSSSKNPVLIGPNGEHLVLKNIDNNTNARYFNALEGTTTKDKGNVIEFVKQRIGTDFKADRNLSVYANVSKILNDYLNIPTEKLSYKYQNVEQTTDNKESQNFILDLYSLKKFNADGYTYLETERKIPTAILESELFKNRIFISEYRGKEFVTFPYYEHTGKQIDGLNFRDNQTNTNARNSNKSNSVWMSEPPQKIEKIIVTESPIDAISHAALNNHQNTLYVSTFGNPTLGQYQSIIHSLKYFEDRIDKETSLSFAYDKDTKGNVFALQAYNSISNGNFFVSTEEDKKEGTISILVAPFKEGSENISRSIFLQKNLFLPLAALKNIDTSNGNCEGIEHLRNGINKLIEIENINGKSEISVENIIGQGIKIKSVANTYLMEQIHEAFVKAMKNDMLVSVILERSENKDYNIDLKKHAETISRMEELAVK